MVNKNIVIIILAVIFSFASCAQKNDTNSDNNNSPVTESAVEVKSALLPEEGVVSAPIHLTTEEFKQLVHNFEKNPAEWVYEGDKPCIIDFWAEWCPPCRAIAPILDEVAKEYAGEIYIYKVDVDSEKQLGQAYGIQSIPTILFVPVNGNPKTEVGAIPKERIVDNVNNFLLKKS